MNWYYIDGPLRVGPLNETEWVELVRSGKIQPETLVWHEGVEKWTPYRLMTPAGLEPEPPDFEEVLEEVAESPQAFAARVVDLEYPVAINQCISKAWATFTSHFWMLVGTTFFISALTLAGSSLPVVHYAMPMALQGVLFGGLYLVYLRMMRGEPTSTGDLFAGFALPLFKPLALTTLVTFLVMALCFVPASISIQVMGIIPPNVEAMMSDNPQQAFALVQETLSADPQKISIFLLVLLACSIPAVYFGFCWMFALPLIVDKGMAFWPAMRLSRSKVLQHPWRISVLLVVAGILGFSGVFGFGIGVIVTLPLYFLIKLFLYEDIFNNSPPNQPADPEKE